MFKNNHLNLLEKLFQDFSHDEIDKYQKLSIDDFIPSNLQDYQLQFDELGVLKKVNQSKKNELLDFF